MSENISCASYLGIYVAETALEHIFDTMEKMPNNTPGYDFICGKGFKIDAKSSVLFNHGNGRWSFSINRNNMPDYFICIGFDDRAHLNPLHVWLIPAFLINKNKNFTISLKNIKRWSEYEMSHEKLELVKQSVGGA